MGTLAPCAGRVTVTTKGLATNMYLRTRVGGHWGPKLKSAGYDTVVIKGKAKGPTYLFIDNGGVHFGKAEHLWGKDTRQTTQGIQEELGDQSIKIPHTPTSPTNPQS